MKFFYMQKNKFIFAFLFVNFLILLIILFLLCKNWQYIHISNRELRTQRELQSMQGVVREEVYTEESPNKENILTLYEIPDIPENYNILILKNKVSKIKNRIFFPNSRDGLPHWIGNEHVFFTEYCGTGCQGISLLNVFTKEIRFGMLTYMDGSDSRDIYTHFNDWFDHNFEFNGWPDEIKSEIINGKVYLIFNMQNEKEKFIGQKKFLFTENSLKE